MKTELMQKVLDAVVRRNDENFIRYIRAKDIRGLNWDLKLNAE